MKKFHLLFLIFFLLIPVSWADITLQTNQNIYNLGNKIKVSASALQSNDFDGLFKLTITCSNYKLEYFLTPISLEANSRTAVEVPELTVTSSMLGNCTITGALTTTEDSTIEQHDSNYFGITSELIVLSINPKITSLPGGTIQVSAIVNEAYGNNVIKAPTKITLDSSIYPVDAIDGRLSFSLIIPKNIKSGRHTIQIDSFDSKGNAGSGAIDLDVTAIPQYLTIGTSSDNLPPGSRANITSSIYDQADDLINDNLELEMVSPKNEKIFKKLVESNKTIEYEFSQFAAPGIYKLTANYRNLVSQSSITISQVRDASIIYSNESVLVENTGNVPFVDELTFVLQNELKKFLITKKVNIEPGKLAVFDLSKEVPEGIYNIFIPLKKDLEALKQSFSGTEQDIGDLAGGDFQKTLADNALIHDNRPIYKRISSGFSSMSAKLVGSNGAISKIPWLGPVLLALVLLLLVFRYGRKPISGIYHRLKHKKSGEHQERLSNSDSSNQKNKEN